MRSAIGAAKRFVAHHTWAEPAVRYWRRHRLIGRIATNTGWNLVGNALAGVFLLTCLALLARILGTERFGEFGLLRTSAEALGALLGFSLGAIVTKHVAEYRHTAPDRAGGVILVSLAATVLAGILALLVLIVAAPFIARHWLEAPHLAGQLRLSGVLVLSLCQLGVIQGALAGLEWFYRVAQVRIAGAVLHLLAVPLAAYVAGLTGAVAMFVTVGVLQTTAAAVLLHMQCQSAGVPLNWKHARREFSVLWRFSLPATLTSTLTASAAWLSAIFLATSAHGIREYAHYAAAQQFYFCLLFLPRVLSYSLLPALCSSTEGAPRAGRRTVATVSGGSALLMLPVVVLGAWLSPMLMGLFGESFRSAWPTLIAMLLAATFTAIVAPLDQWMLSQNRVWLRFSFKFSWAVVFLSLAWSYREHGACAVATALVVAYVMLAGLLTATAMLTAKPSWGTPNWTPFLRGSRVDPAR